MNLKPKAEAARRQHGAEDDDSEYDDLWSGLKKDSRDSTISPSTHKDHIHEENGTSQGANPSPYKCQRQPLASSTTSTLGGSAMGVPIPALMELGASRLHILRSAERLPQITRSSLRELELDMIMGNGKLRADINFDRDLGFCRVNDKTGAERRRLDRLYWEALTIEISIYMYFMDTDSHEPDEQRRQIDAMQTSFEPRLPSMLETLKDVLWVLVPDRDHDNIAENLDVPFIMQQIEKGVLDLVRLIMWLSKLLKSHCAPMRDYLANQMAIEVQEGFESQDAAKTVQGLKTLFKLLEFMKLDVANHQIRAFRLFLIEDSVRSLQIHFLERLLDKTIDAEDARRWFRNGLASVVHQRSTPRLTEFDRVAIVLRRLSYHLITFGDPEALPSTFELDCGRLEALKTNVQDSIGLRICTKVFDRAASSHIPHVSRNWDLYRTLRSRIWAIVSIEGRDCHTFNPQRWTCNISAIALEIALAISHLEARSVGAELPSVPDEHVVTFVENMLALHFNPRSPQYKHYQREVQGELDEATFATTKRYMNMSPFDIYEDQVSASSVDGAEFEPKDVNHIAKGLAHIGVLHWRVWGPIYYNRDPEQQMVFEGKILCFEDQQKLLLYQLKSGQPVLFH